MKKGSRKSCMMERFWSKVNVKGEDDCWEWTSAFDKDGYGLFWLTVQYNAYRSHRISWELQISRIKLEQSWKNIV